MIKIINSIPYSTDSSCRLGYFQHRTSLDPAYHREELYITRQGTYVSTFRSCFFHVQFSLWLIRIELIQTFRTLIFRDRNRRLLNYSEFLDLF